jgi:hypothetical protein
LLFIDQQSPFFTVFEQMPVNYCVIRATLSKHMVAMNWKIVAWIWQ